MIDLVIYGAGGFGKEIACLIDHMMPDTFINQYRFIGFVDDGKPIGTEIKYGKVLGDVSFINEFEGPLAVVFSIANPQILKGALAKITNSDVLYPNVIAPGVTFYDINSCKLGKGNVIFHGCRISCDVQLGDFNLFNGFAAIGHDVQIGNFNILGPSARISGDVQIGSGNFIGLNAAVLQGIQMGNDIRLGAGSILIKNALADGCLYFGNPARKVIL